MKSPAIIGLLIIVSMLAFGAKAFVSNLTPYVTFADARNTHNGSVQVMGSLDKTSIKNTPNGITFDIVAKDNPADRLRVAFTQATPGNFSLAIEVTAIGRYDAGVFHADKLLVKCPSKYQGTETKSYGAK